MNQMQMEVEMELEKYLLQKVVRVYTLSLPIKKSGLVYLLASMQMVILFLIFISFRGCITDVTCLRLVLKTIID